ncbi:MAG: AbrB/MazE/SpoVT family DNA-binding domain-containing protein [Caldivirga sp.]|jgi:AbrB family looped-hinge helix DNA binding protein|nr:MAG: AbrB family transcriptional regulator [Caldivirga sp. MG_3]KUO89021.1 MAG: AbrB family transcriptional regulator [Caldivirga sp. CIS_19]NAZ28086.1 AbrB/MazE/SpoVT family DNA-binding domain-containing protein [Caldivirga sp.]
MRVKVTRNFQITIPAEIRSKLDIREGDYVDITLNEKEGVIIIRPYRRRWTTLKLGRNLTPDEIEELIRETSNEVINEMIGDVNNEAAGGC